MSICIVDFGSQYTKLIARRIRELKVYCEIIPCYQPFDEDYFREKDIQGIILSGGPQSVYSEQAPSFDTRWISHDIPILGICYGMQMLVQHYGGIVEPSDIREYGKCHIFCTDHPLFDISHVSSENLDSISKEHQVWMSHGDHISVIPDGWSVIASSSDGIIAAVAGPKIIALQFHPEVTHTTYGACYLQNFLFQTCRVTPNWFMDDIVARKIEEIRNTVGTKHVLCAMSGGVDSSVVATLIHRAIGKQLHCVFVDNGLLRSHEALEIKTEFSDMNLSILDARERFLTELTGIEDPEEKRKIIGRVFIEVFTDFAKTYTQDFEFEFLAQGTLYPDVIESVSFTGPSVTIKSHHNVGGLPEHIPFVLLEPLRNFFKDEVRQMGEYLGMSKKRIGRQPFPGPGLAVRILGEITAKRIQILQQADDIFGEEILNAGIYYDIWQSFAVLLPIKTVGVMGDQRTYEWVIALRAVHSIDGMTADFVRLPWDVLERTSTRIINEVRGINRVVYDVSHKPPATIEWE